MKKTLFVFMLTIVFTLASVNAQDTGRPVITRENAAAVKSLALLGSDRIFDLDWSSNGEHLVAFSRIQVVLYDMDDLSQVRTLKAEPCKDSQYPCRGSVDFAEDGKTLLASSGYFVTTYNADSGAPLATYETELDTSVMAYSQANALLAFGGGPINAMAFAIREFDAGVMSDAVQPLGWTAPGVRGAVFNQGTPNNLALSPDGRYIAIAYGDLFVSPDMMFSNLSSHTAVFDLQAMFAASDEGQYPYYSVEPDDETFLVPLDGESDRLSHVAFSPDSRLLAGAGLDGTTYLWSMPDGALVHEFDGHYAAVWDVAFSPNGETVASAGGGGMIRFWEAESGEEQLTISHPGTDITAIAFSPDGTRIAAGGWDGSIRVFDTNTGALVDSSAEPIWPGWAVAFNPDGSLLALGTDNNEVILFDVISEPPFLVEKRRLRGHQGPIYSLAFHPDGKSLASGGSDTVIHIWDLETGDLTQSFETVPPSAIQGLAYHPDGIELHCATFSGTGGITDFNQSAQCVTQGEPDTAVYSVAFSPDGSLLAYGDTVIRDLETSEETTLDTFRSWSDSYKSLRSKLTFSANGAVLLNGGTQQSTYIWRVDDLANGFNTFASLLALSPDGTLAAGGDLIIVDTTTGEELRSQLVESEYRSPYGEQAKTLPRDAAFSPDGTLIVTAHVDGTLRVWGIPQD